MQLIKSLMKPIITIGIIAIIMLFAFNIENSLIRTEVINGQQLVIMDLGQYLKNIANTWDQFPLAFEKILPTRTLSDNVFDVANNVACMFDWLYFPINFILWILRLVLWCFKLAMAVLGIETAQLPDGTYANGIISVMSWCIEYLMIPYI